MSVCRCKVSCGGGNINSSVSLSTVQQSRPVAIDSIPVQGLDFVEIVRAFVTVLKCLVVLCSLPVFYDTSIFFTVVRSRSSSFKLGLLHEQLS